MNKKHLKILYSLENPLNKPEDPLNKTDSPFPPLMAHPPPEHRTESVIQQITQINQASASISLQTLDSLIQWLKLRKLLP